MIRAAQLTRQIRHRNQVLKLAELLESANVLGSYQVQVGANGKQKERWAEVEVRAAEVTLVRPREGSTAFVMDRDIREITTWVVEVREVRPPEKEPPLRWVLYTREPASTFTEALRVVEHYEQRPRVEDYHKCLKTGLGVERRRYQSPRASCRRSGWQRCNASASAPLRSEPFAISSAPWQAWAASWGGSATASRAGSRSGAAWKRS